ncbi:hypothetical protein D3C72_1940410 [compost metagenome]
MGTVQGGRRNGRDVIATQIQHSEAIAIEHSFRPLAQLIVSYIQRLQPRKRASIEMAQIVVAQIQPLQVFQAIERSVQNLGVIELIV